MASRSPETAAGSGPPRDLLARLRRATEPFREVLTQPAILTILTIVLGWNVLVELDAVQASLPFIRRSQLAVHRWLCSLSPRSIAPKWVRTVEIDDVFHQRLGEPTDRAFLAKLVSSAVAGDALVVVIDIKLMAPRGMAEGEDDAGRRDQNAELLEAVRDAARRGVPVVLATWLERDAKGSFSRMPNIFHDSDLPLPRGDGGCPDLVDQTVTAYRPSIREPACARLGNINLPVDPRRIPLATPLRDSHAGSESLALAAVSAYEQAMHLEPRTGTKPRIARAIEHDQFPFASFIREDRFQTIPIGALAAGDVDALRLCRGRIVVVGGTWRADLGRGEPVDSHDTPVGPMRGLYLHANYIEALLDERYSSEVPLEGALLFDFLAGTSLYALFHRAKRRRTQLLLLLIPGALLASTYVMFANLNRYLDFILPLGACFAHLTLEYVRDYIDLLKGGGAKHGVARGRATTAEKGGSDMAANKWTVPLWIGFLILLAAIVIWRHRNPTGLVPGGVASSRGAPAASSMDLKKLETDSASADPGGDVWERTSYVAPAGVEGSVEIAPGLESDTAPVAGTLFVTAQDPAGGSAPLAAIEIAAASWPQRFELVVEDAAGLASAEHVVVEARLSKTGSATPESGDLAGASEPVEPGTRDVRVVLDRRLP
jgi:CHASE2 domain-containing sensor protein